MARTPVALVWRGYRFAITASGTYRFEASYKSIRVLVLPDRRLGDGKLRMPGAAHDLKSGRYQEISVLGDLGPVTKIKPTDLPSAFGYVNYYEGQVGMPMGAGSKPIRQLENGHVMRTGSSGRAELLLTPGGYLRMDNSSVLRILSAKTQGAAIELLEGKYLAQILSSAKQAPSTLVWRAQQFLMSTAGLYRFEAHPGNLRVYVQKGKLRLPGVANEVKKGGYVDLTASGPTASPAAFDVNKKDDFDRFNAARIKALQRPRRFPRLFPSQPESQGIVFIPMAAGQL
jgi:hypothetical protein